VGKIIGADAPMQKKLAAPSKKHYFSRLAIPLAPR
jgi:hypothetical protein